MELSKLAELNDSGGAYDWGWQQEAKALQEKTEAAGGVGAVDEDGDSKAALKLSMDNILMVRVAETPSTVAVFAYVCLFGEFCEQHDVTNVISCRYCTVL